MVKCQHKRIGEQQFDKKISERKQIGANIVNELFHDPSLLMVDKPISRPGIIRRKRSYIC